MIVHAIKSGTSTGGRFYGRTHCTDLVPVDHCSRWWPTVTCRNCLRTTAARTATDTSTLVELVLLKRTAVEEQQQ